MSKGAVTLLAVVGGIIGAYIPIWLGWDPTGLAGPSILGGFIGGVAGIFLSAKILGL